MEAVAEKQEVERPRSYKYSLKTPTWSRGRVTQLVAETDNMWIHTKINSEGGENAVHCHLDEDHSFVVLEGQMSVFDEKGNELMIEKYQGVMIPKGAYYRYLNTGDGNLVMLRIGCGIDAKPQRVKMRASAPTASRCRPTRRRTRPLLPSRCPASSSRNPRDRSLRRRTTRT